jgi:UDP-N-acetylenolpyruvoylglucosamine reductase
MKISGSFLLLSTFGWLGLSTSLNYDAVIRETTEKLKGGSNLTTPLADKQNLHLRTLKAKPKPGPKDPCTKLVAIQLGWENWQKLIQTNAAVFRPQTDQELQNILKASRENHCTIRITGARGSHDGLVMERREENIVIISLADYQTSSPAWQDKVFTDTKHVRIGAGRSFYDLTKLIRSKGFLLPTRTAGRYFTIGGVVSNMVHGASKDSGFIHEYVTSLLVMLANGHILEITTENELKYWRSSAGLLGIILAVEFSLLQDTGFQMNLNRKSYNMNDNHFFSTMISDIFTAVIMNDHTEFFFNPYDGELLTLGGNMLFNTPPDEIRLEQYRIASEALVNENLAYDISYQGAPKYPLNSPCDLIPLPYCLDSQATAYIIVGALHDIVESDWNTASTTVNDGFYSTTVAAFHSLDTFAPSMSFPQMLGQFLGLFQAFTQSGSSVYYPTGGLQFRFINPTSKQGILSPIPPIEDLEASFLSNNFFPLPSLDGAPSGYVALHYTGLTNINDEHSDLFLQQLESLFHNTPLDPTSAVGPTNPLIPVKTIHLGKEWGYGFSPVPGMKHTYYPFSDSSLLDEAYSIGKTSALSDFNSKRMELDPNGLFAGGAMMRWLAPNSHPLSYFEPRALNGQSCSDPNILYENTACLSACCGSTTMTCILSGLSSGKECEDSCQCESMNCQAPPAPKGKPSPKDKPGPMRCA